MRAVRTLMLLAMMGSLAGCYYGPPPGYGYGGGYYGGPSVSFGFGFPVCCYGGGWHHHHGYY